MKLIFFPRSIEGDLHKYLHFELEEKLRSLWKVSFEKKNLNKKCIKCLINLWIYASVNWILKSKQPQSEDEVDKYLGDCSNFTINPRFFANQLHNLQIQNILKIFKTKKSY